MQPNNSQSIEQVINKMRDDMIRTQSNANTTAILSFDNLVEQLKVFSQQIVQKNIEIARLQELCKKNKIDTTHKKEEKLISTIPEKPQKTSPSKNVA